MKNKFTAFLGLVLCLVMLVSIVPFGAIAAAQAPVTMTVHNPRGSIEPRPLIPLAERLPTLEGMTIITYSVGMPGNLTRVNEIMVERFGPSYHLPTTTINENPMRVSFGEAMAKSGGVDWQDFHYRYESVARAADAVIVGTAF